MGKGLREREIRKQEVVAQQVLSRKEMTIQHHEYSGPVPDPASLQKYEDISPGFANRLISMAEKEQSFRHDTTYEMIKNEYSLSRVSMVFGFILFFSIIILSAYLFSIDKDAAAITTIVTGLITGVGSFLYYNKNQKQIESSEKDIKKIEETNQKKDQQ